MVQRRSARIGSLGTAGILLGAMAGTSAAPAGASTTVSVDNSRDGWDSSEPGLSPANAASSDFGQLFSTKLDGQVYAQPIVVPAKNGRTAPILIAATENNNVYGLDPATGAILWQRNVGPAWPSINNPAGDVNCSDLAPNIGITATPVYDAATDSVFFTAKVNTADHTKPFYAMHSIDPGSGTERANFPVTIQGHPTNAPTVTFDPQAELSRAGLLDLNGTVYVSFGSICDQLHYRGYIAGVNAAAGGSVKTMWTSSVAGDGGGIWQSGGGLVADGQGGIYLSTGNGPFPAAGPGLTQPGKTPQGNVGMSVVRLGVQPDGSLVTKDFFTPSDTASLNTNDQDLGSGAPVALPDSFGTAKVPHLMVQIGKDGRLFLLNRDNLGGMQQGAPATPGGPPTDAVVQTIGPLDGVWGHPAVWGGDGGYVYVVGNPGSGGLLRAFKIGADASGNPTLTLAGTSSQPFPFGSGSPVITSDGTASGSATLWVVYSNGSAGTGAQLMAFNAIPDANGWKPIATLPIGTASKFAVADTDANRVYVGTREGNIMAFGRPASSILNGSSTDFGTVPVGQAGGATAQVTLTATKNLTINSLASNNPAFTLGPNAPSLPIALTANQSVTVPMTFTPTVQGVAVGSLTASITTASGATGSYAFGLRGTGSGPGLTASPGSVDFSDSDDPTPTGTSVKSAVQLQNFSGKPVTIQSVQTPAAPFAVTGALPAAGTVVEPNGSLSLPVAYSPTAASPASGDHDTITVDTDFGPLQIPLSGQAVNAVKSVSVSPMAIDFGLVTPGTSVTRNITVANTGNVPVTIDKFKPPAGIFSSSTTVSEGFTLGVGNSVTIPVTFSPTDYSAQTAQFEMTPDTGQGAMFIQLSGNTPVLTGPQTTDFGSVPTGTGVNGSVTLTATENLTINSLSISNPAFTPAANSPALPISLTAGQHVTLPMTFKPTVAGTTTATLTASVADGGKTPSYSFGLTGAASGNGLSAPAVTFGTPTPQAADTTSSQNVAVRNVTSGPVTITSAAGPSAPFGSSVVAPGTVIPAGGTLNVNVSYAPAGPSPAGGDAGTLTLGTAAGPLTIGLRGQAVTTVARVAGNDRYLTGVEVSNRQWADAGGDTTGRAQAREVVLARGDAFPDALAGVPLAADVHGPLLLTDSHTLTPETETEIRRILPAGSRVDILGGTSAVSDNVAKRLASLGYTVQRYGGTDRYATALSIAQRINPSKVILATGLNYADALTAGPFATGPGAANGVPAAILLTDDKVIDPVTAGYVRRFAAASTPANPTLFAVGGQAVTAAQRTGGYVKGFAGTDRYATAIQVVQAFPGPLSRLGIASGGGFADALTGGAATAATGGAMVIVPPSLTTDLSNLLSGLAPHLAQVSIFGGPAVISPAEAGQITSAVRGRAQ
jgi:putative cell wall binding repeat protein/HYDIN/CFA65/VesB family protein